MLTLMLPCMYSILKLYNVVKPSSVIKQTCPRVLKSLRTLVFYQRWSGAEHQAKAFFFPFLVKIFTRRLLLSGKEGDNARTKVDAVFLFFCVRSPIYEDSLSHFNLPSHQRSAEM